MLNIVHIYHLRDSYDHSRGYGCNNTYTDLTDATIKELISKQERYLKANDIGGYWIQVIEYEVGGEHKITDHIKLTAEKHRIELNLKAKRTGDRKRRNIEAALQDMQLNAGVALPEPVVAMAPNNVWANVVAYNAEGVI